MSQPVVEGTVINNEGSQRKPSLIQQLREAINRRRSSRTNRPRRQFLSGSGMNVSGSFLATFILVFGGTSVVTVANPNVIKPGIYGAIAIALAFGFSLFAGLVLGGPDAQANPAETLFKSVRKLQPKKMLMLIPAQFLAAIAASILVWICYGNDAVVQAKLGAALPPAGMLPVFIVEAIGTFLLVRLASKLREEGVISHLAVAATAGAVLTAAVFFGLLVSGGSFNPARSFGPAFVSSIGPAALLDAFYLYIPALLGQLLGGIAGVWTESKKMNQTVSGTV